MKKILFLFLALILVSGCVTKTEKSVVENDDVDLNKLEVENQLDVDDIKSDNSISANKTDNKIKPKKTMEKPDNIGQAEDLVSQYSQAIITTNLGNFKVKFYNEDSPITVNNFLNLANSGFYNGVRFHRVIKDFMIQGGDPNSKDENRANDGTGGPGYAFADEFNANKLVKGSLAMANSGPNTNGSQFFIVTAPATPHLDMRHTNFGYIVEGMDVINKIEDSKTDPRDNPIDSVIIKSIELVK